MRGLRDMPVCSMVVRTVRASFLLRVSSTGATSASASCLAVTRVRVTVMVAPADEDEAPAVA